MAIIPNCSRISSDLALIWRYFVLEHAEFCKNLKRMEISRLRSELSRVKMERSILRKAAPYFAKESL